ncbi:hypothetical protein Tco_1210681 [Tanacetum coccineum]
MSTSSSSSSAAATSRRRIPIHCKCGLPLVHHHKKCNAFDWYDPKISCPWYMYQISELYLTQNLDQSFHKLLMEATLVAVFYKFVQIVECCL